jgi:hypothetical protein
MNDSYADHDVHKSLNFVVIYPAHNHR